MKKTKKIEAEVDCIPEHSHLPKAVNVKLIISRRNENELRCGITKVTDIMFLHTATCAALFKIT